MACALTIVARDVSSVKRVIANLALSGTYTTGGEVTTNGFKKDLAMTKFYIVHLEEWNALVTGLVAKWDDAAQKVMLFETAASVDNPLKELTSGASLTNMTFRAEFVGEGNN